MASLCLHQKPVVYNRCLHKFLSTTSSSQVSIMRTPCWAQAALMRQHEIILEIHFRSSVMSVNVIWQVWFDPILWESESVHWRFFTECFYIFANNGCEETMQFYFYNIFLLTERFFNTNYFFPVFQNISWSRISSWSFRLCLSLSPTIKIETHFAERTVGGAVTGKIRVNPGRPWSLELFERQLISMSSTLSWDRWFFNESWVKVSSQENI